MSPGSWVHPEWAGGLIVTAVIAAIALLLSRWRTRRNAQRLLPAPALAGKRGIFAEFALLASVVAIAVALLGPRIGERIVSMPATGVDVVFLLDVSRSMEAADVPPSRLDRARRAAEELLRRLGPQDRAALAAFAGRGVLLTPLTPDHAAIAELLAHIEPAFIEPASSRIGSGLRAALDAFETGSDRPRVIALLGDGEDPDRRRDLAAKEATGAGVRVVTLGFGGDVGSQILVDGVPMRDVDGRAVITRRQLDPLEKLAAETGGVAIAADEWGRIDLDRAHAALSRDAGGTAEEPVERRIRALRVAPFALLAFALLIIEAWPRGERRPWPLPAATVIALVALAAVGPTPVARGNDPMLRNAAYDGAETDGRALVTEGLAHLERGRTAAAASAFLAAAERAREPAVAAVARFNLGVAALTAGDLAGARDVFLTVLAEDPDDREARFNLEWTLGALEQRPASPTVPPQPPAARVPESDSGGAAEEPRTEASTSEGPGRAAPASIVHLTPEQSRRALERVAEDPSGWLRAASQAGPQERPEPGRSAW